MERLSSLSAGFLEAEDADPHVSLALGALSVIAGPMPDYGSIVAAIDQRMLSIPKLRQVIRTHTLDLEAPEWIDVADVDLGHHLHHCGLPHPGDDASLFRLAAEIMERRLDRDRPLWECWIVEGLADDRWAMLMKIHHCIADGIAAMHILSGLGDECDTDTFVSEIQPHDQAPRRPNWLPGLSADPRQWVGGVWQATRALTGAAALAAQGAFEITTGLIRPAGRSSLVGPLGVMRRYSATSVTLDDVTEIRHAFDVTLNDVALAAITDSFRAGLIRRGVKPRRDSLPTLVPVSVRSDDAMGIPDNRVSVMLPYLPVEKAEPVDQLRAVHARLARVKGSGQRQASSVFVTTMNVVPFPLTAWVVRALTKLPQHGIVTLATNVPGPRHPMQIMGRKVLHVYPIPPIGVQLRTVIAILSYADELTFGITADYDAAPDVDELVHGIGEAVSRLVALSRQ